MIPLRSTIPVLRLPAAVIALIAMNLAVFFYQATLPARASNAFVMRYAIVPDRLEYFDILTSMFLHGGWGHILGNMWFLWVFGRNVEEALGTGRFTLFYLLCGVAGALGQIAANPYSTLPMLGASGAISGVMGAYLILFPRSRIVTLVFFIFITFAEVPAWYLLIYWLVVQLAGGIGAVAEEATRGGVAWFAHVGGFAAGALLAKLIHRPRRRSEFEPWQE